MGWVGHGGQFVDRWWFGSSSTTHSWTWSAISAKASAGVRVEPGDQAPDRLCDDVAANLRRLEVEVVAEP